MYKKTVPCACTREGKDRDLTNKNEEKNNDMRPHIAIKHRNQKEKDVRRHQTSKPLRKQTQKADVEAGKQARRQISIQATEQASKQVNKKVMKRSHGLANRQTSKQANNQPNK